LISKINNFYDLKLGYTQPKYLQSNTQTEKKTLEFQPVVESFTDTIKSQLKPYLNDPERHIVPTKDPRVPISMAEIDEHLASNPSKILYSHE
jgi:hypothetical protein